MFGVGLLAFQLFALSEPAQNPEFGLTASYSFEPRFSSIQDLDSRLEDYGFTPVGSPLLLSHGMRARFSLPHGFLVGMAMNYAFALRDGQAGDGLPTTTSFFEFGLLAGRRWGLGLRSSLQVGYAWLTHSLSSLVGGGALVYQGPILTPKISWSPPLSRPFLAISCGYSMQIPIGRPHEIPTWGEGFTRKLVHSLTIGVETGFAVGAWR